MTKIGNIRKWVKDKAGVSPIIAIILMVAITVVLAATIYVWVSGFGGGGGEALSMSVSQVGNLDSSGQASFVVSALSGNASWSNVKILVGSHALKMNTSGALADGYWNVSDKDPSNSYIEAGDVINIYYSGANPGDTLQIISRESGSVICSTTIR